MKKTTIICTLLLVFNKLWISLNQKCSFIFSIWIYFLNRRMFLLFRWNTNSFAADAIIQQGFTRKSQYIFLKSQKKTAYEKEMLRNIKSASLHYYTSSCTVIIIKCKNIFSALSLTVFSIDHDEHSHEGKNSQCA